MKTLSTEQQVELQKLMNDLLSNDSNLDHTQKAVVAYWELELKPKRVRKKVVDVAPEV